MAKGGKQPGAGRKPGVPNKVKIMVAERLANSIISKGEKTPLEIMASIMKQAWDQKNIPLAMQAAKEVAPYLHARLNSSTLSGVAGAPPIRISTDADSAVMQRFVSEILTESQKKEKP